MDLGVSEVEGWWGVGEGGEVAGGRGGCGEVVRAVGRLGGRVGVGSGGEGGRRGHEYGRYKNSRPGNMDATIVFES